MSSAGAHTEAPEGATRDLVFGRGHTLVVRPAVADDAAGLCALFESLDDEDRHRRFFCAFHPSEAFCLGQVTVREQGGARLVAIDTDPETGERRLVAEAGFSLLPTGSGELSITITRPWRGWLGAYLLDLLCDVAAAAGVRNLEADVLTVNQPMMALLRSRGAAVVDHDGFSVVRLRIATEGARPSWDGIDHPRVLIEAPGARWHAESAARDAGGHVLSCNGPRPGRRGCPVLRGEPCPLVAGADVVIVAHAPDDPAWAALVADHPRLHPGVAVHVERAGADDDAAVIDRLLHRDTQ
jgi:hypothetical protein